jgi:hypothetical protein
LLAFLPAYFLSFYWLIELSMRKLEILQAQPYEMLKKHQNIGKICSKIQR